MKINVRYFASLREKACKSQESLSIEEDMSIKDIYLMLCGQYGFSLSFHEIKFSVNNEYVDSAVRPNENDVVVFIPPVAGG